MSERDQSPNQYAHLGPIDAATMKYQAPEAEKRGMVVGPDTTPEQVMEYMVATAMANLTQKIKAMHDGEPGPGAVIIPHDDVEK